MNFYFDTSIWLDFYEKRGDNGEKALKLIMKIIKKDHTLFYSDMNLKELKLLGYSQEEINSILKTLKPHWIKHVHMYKEQLEEARKLGRQRDIPMKDALHAIISRDNDLQLISRDHHFDTLKDVTEAKPSESFIDG
jgi:predicted nucleic acid-binding protein